jgi:major membrane immunogen (membrane-anchored lipoprotein)
VPSECCYPLEEIEIKHDGSYLEATKIKGDDCIRSGEMTFHGSYDGVIPATISVKISTGSPNTTNRQLVDALLEVKTPNKFEVVSGGIKMEFSRQK